MKFGQAVKMAAKSILAKKGRSFLTMLGIIIGIASVMTIVSVVSGYNDKMLEYYKAMGTNRVTAYAYLYSGNDVFEDLYAYCQGLGDMVEGVTPNAQGEAPIKYGARSSDTMEWQDQPRLYYGSDQYAMCNNFTLARGRDICRLDVDGYKQVCVLGAKAAKVLFDYADPIGQRLAIGGVPFTVVGLYEEKDSDSSYSLDNVVVLPYTAARFLPNARPDFNEFTIKVKDAESVNKVITLVQSYIDGITRDQTAGHGYVYSDNQWMDMSNNAMAMISLVLGGIAGISLLVGGIGIMNIMLVTVTERTREIGIRRAIGAERGAIVTQFLVEAAMICGLGGIIGIAIGYVGTNIAGKIMFEGMSILPSPAITLGAFAVSVTLGILFGMYPAIKASGLQPVVALRAD